ncbi:hypothetical protein HD554DRAFT_2044741 [Boletus coccyginus]|nr:hypothetical protein HD554DRAFT_2044741 [Boletus coccyginus]
MDFSLFCLFTMAEHLVRVFIEWMSSDGTWDMQMKISTGATLCGVILLSDKMNITNMCSGRVTYPLLISLANIKMDVRNKESLHAFLLLALMPITKFTHYISRMCSVLAACIGRMMADPIGNLQYYFIPLVSYIVDTPEACMLACVQFNISLVMTATYKDFSNPDHHYQLASIECNVSDVIKYFAACKQFRLSDVLHPFYQDWPPAQSSEFIMPKSLHEWHYEFWDHDVRCGITKLKQVSRRAQRDIQRFIVVTDVITAVHALMEFQYLSQATAITSITCNKIKAVLQEFHDHKHAIIDNGFCQGAKTSSILKHWHIPKIKLMQSVAPNIERIGSLLQWSADTMEHTHIEVINDHASTTNHHNYDSQICWCLNRYEKSLHAAVLPDGKGHDSDKESDNGVIEEDTRNILDSIWALACRVSNFFNIVIQLSSSFLNFVPTLLHTFKARSTAIHLNYDVSHRYVPIDDITEMFELPNLCGALANYLLCEQIFFHNLRSLLDVYLPFGGLYVWYKVHLQQKVYHDSSTVAPTFTVNVHPPDSSWKYGQYDIAVMNIDDQWQWPFSGLQDHAIVNVHLIMCPATLKGCGGVGPHSDHFLVYVQCLDILPQGNRNGSTAEHTRATCTSDSLLGEVFPMDQLQLYAHIVPHFGWKADNRLSLTNCIHSSQSFFLNTYFNKDFFYAIN